jgi:hypothetical protein
VSLERARFSSSGGARTRGGDSRRTRGGNAIRLLSLCWQKGKRRKGSSSCGQSSGSRKDRSPTPVEAACRRGLFVLFEQGLRMLRSRHHTTSGSRRSQPGKSGRSRPNERWIAKHLFVSICFMLLLLVCSISGQETQKINKNKTNQPSVCQSVIARW